MGKQHQDVRMSSQTVRVLETFLENPARELAGAEVQRHGNLGPGTLYPVLLRLEAAGWFVSRWESAVVADVQRPRRRLYRLTSNGLARASAVFADFGQGVPA